MILGAGGHARVLIDLADLLGLEVKGLTSLYHEAGTLVGGKPVLGSDRVLLEREAGEVELAIGFGTTGVSPVRKALFDRMRDAGYRFVTLIHPSACVSGGAAVGEGSQIMAGAVLQTGVEIGENSIINTRASLDHDVCIGDHCHIAPGVVCSGSVEIGDGSHLGVGAVVIEGIKVGSGSMVAAGAVVVENLAPEARVKGVPARNF
ncbi:acetyltransferase [Akkermansiaceae bacterium]|nr:acetyltransferase [Akkermansiaceae bacterium]MDA7887875.1 acetyltransferase [Akkermansiaceae bacterium]MDB4544663.1 acetyltransferase [Akkermansiaceae bacterium]